MAEITAQNRAAMAPDISIYNPVFQQRLQAVTGHLITTGTPVSVAQTQAMAVINGQVTAQAMMLSFEHMFLLFGITMVALLPLLFFMNAKSKTQGGGVGH